MSSGAVIGFALCIAMSVLAVPVDESERAGKMSHDSKRPGVAGRIVEGIELKEDAEKQLGLTNSSIIGNEGAIDEDKSQGEDSLEAASKDDEDGRTKNSSMLGAGRTIRVFDTQPPEIFPEDNSVTNMKNASPELLKQLNMTRYMTEMPENDASHSPDNSSESVLVVPMPTNMPKTTGNTEVSSGSSVPTESASLPTMNPSIALPSSSSPSPDELKLHEIKIHHRDPMPPGVIVVIATIAFAITAVLAYVALLLRRRYFEWRHGNRELLVNDFDPADMSNFEL